MSAKGRMSVDRPRSGSSSRGGRPPVRGPDEQAGVGRLKAGLLEVVGRHLLGDL